MSILAAKQCCTELRPFLAKGPRSCEGRDLGQLADLNRPKGYSIPYDIKQKEF